MSYVCKTIARKELTEGVSVVEDDFGDYADLVLATGDDCIHLSLKQVDALIPILQRWAARQYEDRALLLKPEPESAGRIDGIEI